MAGTNAGFDAAGFRQAIRDTMIMGLPNTVAARPTFRWRTERAYWNPDPGGNTYDFTAVPTSETVIADLQVPCAVEFTSAGAAGDTTVVGQFDTTRIKVTLLDEEWRALLARGGRTPDEIIHSGNTYIVEYQEPVVALFDVDVHTIHASARDES